MHNDIRVIVLGAAVLAVVAMFIAHVFMARFYLAKRPNASAQKTTVFVALMMNLPLVAGSGVVLLSVGKYDFTDLAYALIYELIVYNSISYAYFHLFNLSETGRRIKMLRMLLDNPELRYAELTQGYNPQVMVANRLERLEQMNQISKRDGHYHLQGKLMWRIACLIRFFGQLFAGLARK